MKKTKDLKVEVSAGEWCEEVVMTIESAPLAVAGYEVARLVNFALKTAHDDAFNREVRNCVHLFQERCTREGGAV